MSKRNYIDKVPRDESETDPEGGTRSPFKLEDHDNKLWLGVSKANIWKALAAIIAFVWLGGGKDATFGTKEVTKDDISRVEREIKSLDNKVSFLSGRMGVSSYENDGSR